MTKLTHTDHASHSPIRRRCVRIIALDLRRGERPRAHVPAAGAMHWVREVCQPKVTQERAAVLINQDVRGLDVAVHDAEVVQPLNSLQTTSERVGSLEING